MSSCIISVGTKRAVSCSNAGNSGDDDGQRAKQRRQQRKSDSRQIQCEVEIHNTERVLSCYEFVYIFAGFTNIYEY